MLNTLSIRNVVLIEKLDLEFPAGFLALTGETGAGKSILLDALSLALGRRSDVGLVGKAAEKASVTAVFEVDADHAALKILESNDLDVEGSEIILRRTVDGSGRSKAYLNDQTVTVGLLRQIGDELMEVHGQFDQYGLMNAKTHLGLLDKYSNTAPQVVAVEALFHEWKSLEERLRTAEKNVEETKQEEDFLRGAVSDLEGLHAEEGEETKLVERRSMMSHAKKIIEGVNDIMLEISGDSAIEERLYKVSKIFDRLSDALGDRASSYDGFIETISTTLDDLKEDLEGLVANVSEESASFEVMDDRLFALREMARKYKSHPDQLPALLDAYQEKLSMIDNVSNIDALRKQESVACAGYVAAAEKLRQSRQLESLNMKKEIETELAPLKLENVKFQVNFEELAQENWRATGLDKVSFEVSTNPGQPFGPLGKVASGGELSRLMLALKVVLHRDVGSKTLIFDEVDSGIGGPTADAVGKRLKRLGEKNQVLVVTHSPQVAACANQHYHVSKQDHGEGIRTAVDALDNAQRIEELSRMLSGEDITEEARQAARKLMVNG